MLFGRMRRTGTATVLLAAAASLVLLISPSVSGSATLFQDCGNITNQAPGVNNVEAKRLNCTFARRVASQYFRARGPESFGLRCREQKLGLDTFQGRCAKNSGKQVVRFLFEI